MAQPLITYDNNIGNPLQIDNEIQLHDFETIAGKRISWLCNDAGNDNLLVFPRHLNEYGDKIGDSTIFDINGDTLITGNIMGFVGVGDSMLKIGSRFDLGRNDCFMHYMLERVFSINMFDFKYSYNNHDIFDFILFLFPYYLKNALSQGLYKEYKTFERNDAKLRGVLDVSRHIRTNIPMTGAIAYKSREHTYDNNITELARHTIEYIKTKEYGDSILYHDEQTKTFVSQIMDSTPSYNKNHRQKVISSCIRPKIHPYYSEYDPLRQLCMKILQHEEIKYGNNKDTVYGILFDGAWLWEEYLNKILENLEITHSRNNLREGYIYLFQNNSAERYPDFYCDNLILDAKYKGYSGCKVSDIGREDLAQVISYMYVEKAAHGLVLSPGQAVGRIESLTLRGYGGTMSLVEMPISGSQDYDVFSNDMATNEQWLRQEIGNFMGTHQSEMTTPIRNSSNVNKTNIH